MTELKPPLADVIEKAEKMRHAVYMAAPEDVAFDIAQTLENLISYTRAMSPVMSEKLNFSLDLIQRLIDEPENKWMQGDLDLLKSALAQTPTATDSEAQKALDELEILEKNYDYPELGKYRVSDASFKTIRAALSRMAPQWQDISTAPRDGTHFWGWLNSKGIVKMMYQTPEQYCEAMAERGRGEFQPSDYEAAFVMVDDIYEEWEPEYWMPLAALPAPPADRRGDMSQYFIYEPEYHSKPDFFPDQETWEKAIKDFDFLGKYCGDGWEESVNWVIAGILPDGVFYDENAPDEIWQEEDEFYKKYATHVTEETIIHHLDENGNDEDGYHWGDYNYIATWNFVEKQNDQ